MTSRAPEDLGEWASLYRQARTPSETLRASVRQQLHAPVTDHADPEPAANLTPSQWGLGLVVGGLLGAAAVLALTCGLDAMRSNAAPSDAPDIAPMQRAPSEEGNIQSPPPRQPAPMRAVQAPAEPPAVDPSPPGPRRPRRPAPTPSTQEPGASDLESLRALRAAERALRKDPAQARVLLEQHARDYPDSKLWLEREALWIRAACRSGGAKGLEARRASFAKRADVAAYRSAIDQDCAVREKVKTE